MIDTQNYTQGLETIPDRTKQIICVMAEELWLKVEGYPMPDTFSDKEKRLYYQDNHLKYLQSLAKTASNSILYHKNYDITFLKAMVLQLPEELWFSDTERQKAYIVHRQTQSIINTDVSIFYKSNDPFEPKESNILPHYLKEYTNEIIKDLERTFDGKVGKSSYVRLNAGCFIPEHSDNFEYLRMVHRFHIPIVTNPDVLFKVGEESVNMKEGECYEIDVSLLHSVWNNGDTPRVHLIVDIMPNELIK
jgi:hypothetical protein